MNETTNSVPSIVTQAQQARDSIQHHIRERLASSHRYDLQTCWKIPGTIDEVAELLLDPNGLNSWWGGSFLQSHVCRLGERHVLGREMLVTTRGFLPYTVSFQLKVTEVVFPRYFQVESTGDFVGSGSGCLIQTDDGVQVVFEWHIDVAKPLLRMFSWIARPLFIANHRWIMWQGQKRVRKIIAQRQPKTCHLSSTETDRCGRDPSSPPHIAEQERNSMRERSVIASVPQAE